MPPVPHSVTRSLRNQHPKPGHPLKEHTGPLSVVAGWRAGLALNYMGSVADLGVQKGCTLLTPWFPCGLGPCAVSSQCPCRDFAPRRREMCLVRPAYVDRGRNSKLFILTHLGNYSPSDQAASRGVSSTIKNECKRVVYFKPIPNRHPSLIPPLSSLLRKCTALGSNLSFVHLAALTWCCDGGVLGALWAPKS